jgi:hypothetical protein
MADKLAKLKKKLAKQKQQTAEDFLRAPKRKKKTLRTSTRQMEQRNFEDQNMKTFLRKLLSMNLDNASLPEVKDAIKEYYPEASRAIKKTDPSLEPQALKARVQELWEALPRDEKINRVLNAFGDKRNVGWSRKGFVRKLTALSPDLISLYIAAYLKQNDSYHIFFEEWVEEPDIAPRIDLVGLDRGDGALQSPVEDDPDHVTRQEVMDDARAKARGYAEEKGITVTSPSYYGMLDEIAHAQNKAIAKKLALAQRKLREARAQSAQLRIQLRQKTITKSQRNKKRKALRIPWYEGKIKKYQSQIEEAALQLHPIILADLMARARELGVPNPEELSLGDIYTRMRTTSPQTRSRLVERAAEYDIAGAEDLDILSLKQRITEAEQGLTGKQRAARHAKKLKSITKKLKALKPVKRPGIKTMVRDEDLVDFVGLVQGQHQKLAKLSDAQLIALASQWGIKVDKTKYNRGKLLPQIIERELESAVLVDAEKSALAHKLSILMDVPVKSFREWTVEALQRKYDDLGGGTAIEEARYGDAIDSVLEERLAAQDEAAYAQLRKSASECTHRRYAFPWIKMKVEAAWITAAPNKELNLVYVHDDEGSMRMGDGSVWYRANVRFTVLQCTALSRVQEGNVLSCTTHDGKLEEFMVGYLVTSGRNTLSPTLLTADGRKYVGSATMDSNKTIRVFSSVGDVVAWRKTPVRKALIIQNEALFHQEREYMKWKQSTRNDRIRALLDRQHTDQTLKIAGNQLGVALRKAAPDIKDYGNISYSFKNKDGSVTHFYDSETIYINLVMANLGISPRDSNRELFAAVAGIIAYLTIAQAKTFRKRIRAEYYLPESLAVLSPGDKLPEVFENPKVSDEDIERMTAYIRAKKERIVEDIANTAYTLENPTERRPLRSIMRSRDIPIQHALRRLESCQNLEDVADENQEDIIVYTEGDINYCFSLDALLQQIKSGNVTNPKTGRDFNDAFLQKLVQTYDIDLTTGGIMQTDFARKYNFDLPKEQDRQETGVDQDQLIEQEVEEAFMIIPNMWKIVVKDVAEREEDMAKEHVDDQETGESTSVSQEEEEEAESDPKRKGDEPVSKEDACEYCKKHIHPDSGFKSVIFHADTSKIVRFCTINCFENKDWPKAPGKKKRKKRSTRRKSAKKSRRK